MSAVYDVSIALQDIAKTINAKLESIAGEKVGFSLVVYTFPRASYVGNCDRQDAIRELKTLLDYWESGMPDIPAHEIL